MPLKYYEIGEVSVMISPVACKICNAPAPFRLDLPRTKESGRPIPPGPSDIAFYECPDCGFLFTRDLDNISHAGIYNEEYWKDQDPDWYGRVSETLRLVMMGLSISNRVPNEAQILDYGCGMGAAVEVMRNKLDMKVWGTDIIRPKFSQEYFLSDIPRTKFDVVVACEVIEHLPDPLASFRAMRDSLIPSGAIAFQTACWDGKLLDRNWWYLGPGNGHISLYAPTTFDYLATKIGARKRQLWNDYPGIQAWLF